MAGYDLDRTTVYDSPPESFLLSDEAKLEWLGSNAFFFHRKDSAKFADSNNDSTVKGKASLTSYSPRSNPRSADFESRASSIIGLPKLRMPLKKDHQKNTRTCLFPRLDGLTSVEPHSPTVTCIGRVRSRRGQGRVLHPEVPISGMRTNRIRTLGSLLLSGCKAQQAVDVVVRSEQGDARNVDAVAKQKLPLGYGPAP